MTTNLITKLSKSFVLAPSICPHCGEDVNTKILRVTGDTVRDHFTTWAAGVKDVEPVVYVTVKNNYPAEGISGKPQRSS
jgi:hypothetical protein